MYLAKRIGFLTSLFLFAGFAFQVSAARIVQPIKNEVNVRVDSTPMSDSIGVLQKSDTVEVIEERYDWCRVRLPRRITCYVSADFLQNMGDGKGRVTATQLNLRSKPAQDSYVLGKAKKGDLLSILEQKDGWYKVIGYPYLLGWVHKSLLRPVPAARLIREEGVVLYLKPQRGCPANCLFKSDQKYPLLISSPRYQKFINRKVRIVGRRLRGACDYVVVKKISFKR